MATKTINVELKGPLFESGQQISLGFTEAVNRGLFDLATFEGSNKVKEQLVPGNGRITGNLRNHVGAALIRDGVALIAAGEQLGRRNLIYAEWVEGNTDRNRPRPGFPGYHMFRKVEDRLDNNPQLYEDYLAGGIVEAFD
jgi:hypothetical protein